MRNLAGAPMSHLQGNSPIHNSFDVHGCNLPFLQTFHGLPASNVRLYSFLGRLDWVPDNGNGANDFNEGEIVGRKRRFDMSVSVLRCLVCYSRHDLCASRSRR